MSVRLGLKVIPGATVEVAQWFGEGLKVKVRTAPEKGKANLAVERLLAKRLKLPLKSVKIVSGFTNSQKIVEIDDLSVIKIKDLLST